jgi:hypothetical protein
MVAPTSPIEFRLIPKPGVTTGDRSVKKPRGPLGGGDAASLLEGWVAESVWLSN